MSFRDKFPMISYFIGKRLQVLNTFFFRKNPLKWTLKTYKKRYGIELNLENPQSFYEKMNYWKHFKYDPNQDVLTDKIDVKKYLQDLGYGDLCAKCYFVSDNIRDLKKWYYQNYTTLQKFVLKTSHSCGDVFIYDNGKITKKNGRKIANIRKVFKMLKRGLKFNHYYSCFEQNYKNLKPRVYVEEYIDFDQETVEYELMCNYGKIVFSNVVFGRQSNNQIKMFYDDKFCFYAKNFGEPTKELIDRISKPREFDRITKLITAVCKKFPFCRADFVQTKNKTYFCEFTFVKSGGIDAYQPLELNDKFGSLFKL